MIELQRHIEILLLTNDCVIVPDFGGFMTHESAARYDEGDHTFLPPLRTLGFNPQLRLNDSVLAQSYVEAYDISYPEALRRIEHEVNELRERLSEEGSYVMDDLGTLTVNQDGHYEFAPCESGILSPALYGLGAFTFNRLNDEAPVAVEKPLAPAAIEEEEFKGETQPTLLEFTDDNEDHGAIVIKMSWIRNAIAVAAAAIAFFLIATPVANSDLGNQAMSQLQGQWFCKLIPQDTNALSAEPMAEPAKPEKAMKPAQPVPPITMPSPVDDKPYCLVLASQVKKTNAELYVEQLHKKGYMEAAVYIHKGIVRVVYGNFQTEEDAYRQLSSLTHKKDFEEAWVYKKKPEA